MPQIASTCQCELDQLTIDNWNTDDHLNALALLEHCLDTIPSDQLGADNRVGRMFDHVAKLTHMYEQIHYPMN